MSVSQSIAPHLPSLRRFARALSGSQESGDAYVVALLEALVDDPALFPAGLEPKIALYRVFLKIWNSVGTNDFPTFASETSEAIHGLQTLTPKPRQAFLLLSVEGFDADAIAKILDIDTGEVALLIAAADHEIASQLDPADILIIEDEPLTAAHLEEIVTGIGHNVTGTARTHSAALKLAKENQPDLILSDIQLADGSSGVEAVNEILGSLELPVIFITGHPELLLTGAKPEPTFLIAKPFNAETVKAIIGQALFFQVRSRVKDGNGVLSRNASESAADAR
ncbi:response regulator [Rhodomicrobium lacus]|jgi:CheY-like chemotaxis protein/DNA-directed RNA polymerase specialized sigma24 family protein|uniref:response regulator n=1 Tax=Rhodomicrobium TaxID=1068 RepID=UPI000F8CAC9D|nr:response regulator [Rhodomicrobium lacus]WKW50048.1 response regulator [Rhodomicrobium lacus]